MNQSARTLWPYIRRYKRGFALGMASLVMKDVLAVALPLVIRNGIDSLARGFRFETVLWFAAALVLLSALKGLFQFWMRVVLIGISRDIEFDLRNDIFRHLAGLSWDFYAKFRTGDIMARATNDLNAVRMMLGPGIMYWCETMITLILAVIVMLAVDWPLTLMALTPAPLVSFAVMFFGSRIHERFERIQAKFADISSRVQENVAGARIIRAYVQEEPELRRFETLNRDYVADNIRLARLSALFMPLLQALIGFTFLLVLWVGGRRVLTGDITLGDFVMFNTYMGMLVWPMIALGWVVNLMQRGTASLSRIREIMDARPSIAEPASPALVNGNLRGAVEYREVVVDFPAARAVDDVSLRIPAGSTAAIVGHTGSGKSVLVSLIPRLMDPTAGKVFMDGIDVRSMSPSELRRNIGFVPQETFLFSATLAENIAFGAPDASEEEIRRAADMAGLGPDLESFPNGLQTMVGERGITLSGGQKQRTAIARAIIRDPRILVLDDALASVDTLTEERILEHLTRIRQDRTTILISHRVSTVRTAEHIFVLNQGRIVEEGTHTELAQNGGYYADLYQKQLLEEELEAI